MINLRITNGEDPEAQARPRLYRRGAHVGAYSPKTKWYWHVYAEAVATRPKTPLEGPLLLSVVFIFKRPKSVKPGATWKATRPDGDNLGKAIMDAATKARWWNDDSQVALSVFVKRYAAAGEPPGAEIKVEALK